MPDRRNLGPYLQAAFWSTWNLGGIAAVVGAAAVTGDTTWFVAVGAVLEAVWLGATLQSPRFRRAVDGRALQHRRDQSLQSTRDELALLPTPDRTIVQQVATMAGEVRAECQRNPRLGGELLRPELEQLEATIADYVHLAVVAYRCETYLARADARKIRKERDEWLESVESHEDETVRALARRNIEVLERRLTMVEEIKRFAERARTQMSLVQNTVALLRDQVLTVSTPEALTQELEALVSSIDAIREATREVESAISPRASDAESEPPEPTPGGSERGGVRVRH
jgi:hypothetical protein